MIHDEEQKNMIFESSWMLPWANFRSFSRTWFPNCHRSYNNSRAGGSGKIPKINYFDCLESGHIENNWKMNRFKAIRCLIALGNAWEAFVFSIQGSTINRQFTGLWLVTEGAILILIGRWGSCWILIGRCTDIWRRRKQTGVIQPPSAVFVMDWFWFE